LPICSVANPLYKFRVVIHLIYVRLFKYLRQYFTRSPANGQIWTQYVLLISVAECGSGKFILDPGTFFSISYFGFSWPWAEEWFKILTMAYLYQILKYFCMKCIWIDIWKTVHFEVKMPIKDKFEEKKTRGIHLFQQRNRCALYFVRS
jgi:hypothetical protein